jgi:protoporphyrinogen oxidase
MKKKIAIIGAGFTGLSAAYDLAKNGLDVSIFERNNEIGGLAESFSAGNQKLEKFYHHWLGTDVEIFNFIKELGLSNNLIFKESKVGIYYSNKTYRFSSPLDLLNFKPLPFFSRVRFGLSIIYSWFVSDYSKLEKISAEDWLLKTAGKPAYEKVWKPLLIGKFGKSFYKKVAAIWLWNKLIQRGKSRDVKANEKLGYYKKGFHKFLLDLKSILLKKNVKFYLKHDLKNFTVKSSGKITLHFSNGKNYEFNEILYTGHTPEFALLIDKSKSLIQNHATLSNYSKKLKKIDYLANICIILETKKSLTEMYWLNINDPKFPFVGIIEHTNFENKKNYSGNNLIYLSKYLPKNDTLYSMCNEKLKNYALTHMRKMFPDFAISNIKKIHVWKADYAQPIIKKNYHKLIPSYNTPIKNIYLATMAQVYPQDRGTNYAVYHGRKIAKIISKRVTND